MLEINTTTIRHMFLLVIMISPKSGKKWTMFQQHSIYDFRCAHTCKCQISKEAKIIFLSYSQINVFINNRMYASAASGSIQIFTEIRLFSPCASYLVLEGFRTFPKKESKLLNIHLKIQAQLKHCLNLTNIQKHTRCYYAWLVWKVPQRQRVQKTHLAQQNATQKN